METFNPPEAMTAQKKLTTERKFPHFAPYNGQCYDCKQNIYQLLTTPSGNQSGISVECAGLSLVTVCPHCHYSYCD